MSLAQHRAAIVDLMATVPGIGIVHPEEPYAKTQQAFQAAYLWDLPGGGQQLRGWYVVRTKTRETSPSNGRTVNVHSWKLQGFMALGDAGSGVEWDSVVEALRAAFRADPTLGGVAQPGPLNQTSGAQVVSSLPVVFAGVLCHSTQLELQTYAFF